MCAKKTVNGQYRCNPEGSAQSLESFPKELNFGHPIYFYALFQKVAWAAEVVKFGYSVLWAVRNKGGGRREARQLQSLLLQPFSAGLDPHHLDSSIFIDIHDDFSISLADHIFVGYGHDV